MKREIFQFLMIIFLVGGLFTFVDAQVTPPDACPILTISGPAGIVDAGDLGTYTASIDLKGLPGNPTYRWTMSVGEIVSGQGTNSIKVRQPSGGCITATVEVGGFPDSCPLVVIESSCGLPPPDAIKIGEMRDIEEAVAVIKQFAAELENNPNNQGYILIGHPAGTTQPQMYARERAVRDAVRKADPDNFDDSRITITAVEGSADVVEFWRVPPGANNPKCGSCAIRRPCPEVKIAGPAGYIEPGGEAKFALSPELAEKNLRIEWSVDLGNIVEGNGTAAITVIAPTGGDGGILTAVVKVLGLPIECSQTASGSAMIRRNVGTPITLEQYGSISIREERTKLDGVAAEWRKEPSFYLYFILSQTADEPRSVEMARIKRIKDHLIGTRKIPSARLVFVNGGKHGRSTTVYLITEAAHADIAFKPT